MTDDEIRLRFFKDLTAGQRLAVFKAFGVYPDNCTESLNHGIEYRLLKSILNRRSASPYTERELALLRMGLRSLRKEFSGKLHDYRLSPPVTDNDMEVVEHFRRDIAEIDALIAKYSAAPDTPIAKGAAGQQDERSAPTGEPCGNALTWTKVADRLPDSDTTVMLFDKEASEPVWPGYLDGDMCRYVDGMPAQPTHWADLPEGPEA